MNKSKFLFFGIHVLFCVLLIYWFYNNSFIRPYAILHSYKEVVCAGLVLLLMYLNYCILTPYFIKRSYYTTYLFLSLLVTGIVAIVELLMVKVDIIRCLGDNDSFDIDNYLFRILFVIFLRDMSFYLFSTILRLYLLSKANTLLVKQMALKETGLILLLLPRGNPISININFVSYFSQNHNYTFIHNIIGKPASTYTSLNYIQNYLDDYCLRINRDIIVTFTNIVCYNKERIIVKDGKSDVKKSFTFYKNTANDILLTLREKVPELEEKNAENIQNLLNGNVNDDKKMKIGNEKMEILEEIRNNPGINAIILSQKIPKKTSLRTIRRRVKELKDAGIIEFRGSDKTGGYYIV